MAERNSTSPHYIANGERDIHLFILNVKGTDTRASWQKRRKKRDLPFFERAEKTFDEKRRREGLGGFFIPLFFFRGLTLLVRFDNFYRHCDMAENRGMSLILFVQRYFRDSNGAYLSDRAYSF